MWKEIYVICPSQPGIVRKVPIFVFEGKVYSSNICDFGNGSESCTKCYSCLYMMFKNNPALLSKRYTPDNPLYLKLD